MWNNSCVEVFITECILSLSGLPYSSLATRTPKQRSLLAPAECKWPRQPQHRGYHRRPRWRCLANWSRWKAEKLLMIFKHRPMIVELLVWLFFANLSSPVVSANAGTQRQISNFFSQLGYSVWIWFYPWLFGIPSKVRWVCPGRSYIVCITQRIPLASIFAETRQSPHD